MDLASHYLLINTYISTLPIILTAMINNCAPIVMFTYDFGRHHLWNLIYRAHVIQRPLQQYFLLHFAIFISQNLPRKLSRIKVPFVLAVPSEDLSDRYFQNWLRSRLPESLCNVLQKLRFI